MKKSIVICLTSILLSIYACQPKVEETSNSKEMPYRSISFHIEPDSASILMGAEMGFNDICIQTEGDTEKRLKQLREAEDKYGYMQLAKSLNMSISVWIREISNYDKAWGELSLENELLWQKMNEKYDYYMTELIPEADNFILTVVESQINIADNREILLKVIDLIINKCKQYNKELILRTFVHYPHEYDTIIANLNLIPDDVKIMTKYVPSDWNLRGPNNMLIGKVGQKDQYIELDICGEYWRNTYLPNTWTTDLSKRFKFWSDNSCDGISVRIDRSHRPGAWWEPITYYHKVQGHAQEANLYTLGYLASGIENAEEKAWKDWAIKYFNEEIATEIIEIFKPQGQIVAEALNVEAEPFGSTRNKIPAEWTMNGQHCKCHDTVATAFADEDDMLYRTPFYQKFSPNVWNPDLKPRYHLMRKGDADVVKNKTQSYANALAISESSIDSFIALKNKIDEKSYAFHLFKLEENKFHLQAMCEAELAWLKANQNLYYFNDDNKELNLEIEGHLNNISELHKLTNQELVMNWQGRDYDIKRGEYLDLEGFIELFKKYWEMN